MIQRIFKVDDYIQFACFKGISPLSKLIKWWTRGTYSHIGYVINNDTMRLIEIWNGKYWAYSTFSNHRKGTPVDIFRLKVTSDVKDKVDDQFISFVKHKIRYDYKGLFGFVFKTKDDESKLFCSEGCGTALYKAGLWPKLRFYRIHPSYFVDLIKVYGFELVETITC